MKIFARPSHQLGNSLRSTITMKIFADSIGAEFYVDGNRVDALDHQKDRVIMKSLFADYIRYNEPYTMIDERDLFDFKSWGSTSELLLEGTFKYRPTVDFAVDHIYSMKSVDMSDETYCKNKIEFYKSLKWPQFLKDEVIKFNPTNLIGVHIRYTDNLPDPKRNNTHLDTFIEKIKTLDGNILLCSDNQDVINTITGLFPNIILPNKIENILYQSLYEMMLLSDTKYIIGSYTSTFSYEAAFFKGTDIELFNDNKWTKYCLT